MASILGHIVTGYTSGKLIRYHAHWSLLLLAALSAFLPDIDVIGFKFGIDYGHTFGHRGFTHSLFFALVWAIFIGLFFPKMRITAIVIIFVATVSHGLLDAMTTGGLGIAFFSPFTNTRYFLPWRPIKVSPIGVDRFISKWGWMVIQSELIFVVLPCAILLTIKRFIKK